MIVFDYKGYQESRRRPESTKYYVRKKMFFFMLDDTKTLGKYVILIYLQFFSFQLD